MVREHWARQRIVQRIILAITEAKMDKSLAVPAGKAADDILKLLFEPLDERFDFFAKEL